jgi:DNA-binding transcriptional LysR family regulator
VSIDLNLLVALDAVLREGTVAKAAKRLHVTPSAVSNSLAKLRASLGDPLLTRRGRGLVATPRATELGPVIARALGDLNTALEARTFDPMTTTRTFTLAIADAGQIVAVPRIAALLAEEMPSASLRVIGVDSLVSLGGVAGTEVDVAIGVPETVPGIHKEALFEEPTCLVARRSNKATRLQLLRHVAVEMVPGKGFRDPVAGAYARAGIPRSVVLTVPTFTSAAAIVAETGYVTTLPSSLYSALAPRFGLRTIAGAPAHMVSMCMWWHERTHADEALVAFRAVLRRAVSEDRRPATSGPGRGLLPGTRRPRGRGRGDRR